MAMNSLNIFLPESLDTYVSQQVSSGAYGTPSEYIRALIRQDRERLTMRLEAELSDALASSDLTVDFALLAEHPLPEILRNKLRSDSK